MAGRYKVGTVKQHEILAPGGKVRVVSTMNSVDRLLARALLQVISEDVDKTLSENCFSYRTSCSTWDMAKTVANYIEAGNESVLEVDVKDFFDTIPHDKLIDIVSESFSDETVIELIKAFIKCQVDNDGDIYYLNQGILQGSPLSPLLSNMFMRDVDEHLSKISECYCRYGDDIRLYFKSTEEAEKHRNVVESILIKKGLRINKKKTGVYSAINRICLGYEFFEKGGHIYAQRTVKKKNEVYRSWSRDSVRKIDRNYHIVSDGILTKKDYTVLFQNEEGNYYLPVEIMDSLSVYSNVTFSGNFFAFASKEQLFVHMIDRFGNRVGTFVPERKKGDYQVEMEQIRVLNDEKLHIKLARKYQNANIFNVRANLRYYERRSHNEILKGTIDNITEILEKVKNASTIESIMMYEAQAKQQYYACFGEIMENESFVFEKRTRRPPMNPVNAMISFGNTLLYTRFANEIYRSSMDIRFGILHNSSKRAESLNLDLADLFKPVLVDRTIFTLVNRNMLDVSRDFRTIENGGVYLSDNGKRLFIKEFERKMYQKVKIKNETKTYEQLIREEVRKLSAYFRSGKDYKPYRYVN